MKSPRWHGVAHFLPGALALLASVITITGAAVGPEDNPWRWAGYLGGVLAAVSGAWILIRGYGTRVDADSTSEDSETTELKELREQIHTEVVALERRRREIGDTMMVNRGWLEVPEPWEDLNAVADSGADAWSEQDQEVLRICRRESEILFNKTKNNSYIRDDGVDLKVIYEDFYEFFEKIARVYRPAVSHPLAETSLEEILRFVNRVSLQLLVQLDQLPVDVKRYTFVEIYQMIRKTMDYYGIYKALSPYWDAMKPAYFLGRLVLGSNPLTMGVGWTVTELANRGGKKLSTTYAKRYGMRLFHETIRILGSEAAAVYGGRVRHRDPYWIYGLELVEMVSHMQRSEELLRSALTEIESLPLQSEYDRMYLYRCLIRHESSQPDRFPVAPQVSETQRNTIRDRFKTWADKHENEWPDSSRLQWSEGFYRRLGKSGKTTNDALDPVESGRRILHSLVSYLIDVKQMEPEGAVAGLRGTAAFGRLPEGAARDAIREIELAPPMVFDHPDLPTGSESAMTFLTDLTDLQVGTPPHSAGGELLTDVAHDLGIDGDVTQRIRDAACGRWLGGRLVTESPVRKLRGSLARALIGYLEDNERPVLIYDRIEIDRKSFTEKIPKDVYLVALTSGRLVLVGGGADQNCAQLWSGRTGRNGVEWDEEKPTLRWLRGGRWLLDREETHEPPRIGLRAPGRKEAEAWFAPLEAFLVGEKWESDE